MGIGTPLLLGAGSAQAGTCAASAACDVTGTADLGTGTLSMTAPPAIGWLGPVTTLDQELADPTSADQAYEVDNALGLTTATWSVTAQGTQFTDANSNVLPATGTLSTNGSVTTGASGTNVAPTAACLTGSTCTLPTDTVAAYPVAIGTPGTTSATIYAASAGTGLGSITIGAPGINPVGWWLNVPGNTLAGTYISTVTLTVNSGP